MGKVVRIEARAGSHRAANWALLAGALLLSACAASTANPVANAAPPQEPARAANPPPNDSRQLLTRALRGVDDQGSPLLALDAQTKTAIDQTLAKLSASEREQIATNVDFARRRPLLHLAAAGVAPAAYEALIANGMAAEEIVRGRIEAQVTTFTGLNPVVLGVVSRAASRVLRDASAALDAGGELGTDLLARVAAASEALHRNDLAEQALALLLAGHPDSIYGYELARLYAEGGQIEAARSTLRKLTAQGGQARALAARSEKLLAAAVLLHDAPASPAANLDAALPRVQAQLTLRQFPEALRTLAPFEPKGAAGTVTVDNQLGLATAWAEASLEGTLCPGLPPGIGVAELCATNWRNAPLRDPIETRLDAAWRSGSGRDSGSIETYLGLRFVVPLLYQGVASEPSSAHAAPLEDVKRLEQELASVRTVSPRFAALQLFTRVLGGALQTGAKSRGSLDAKAKDALVGDTVAVIKNAGRTASSTSNDSEPDRVAQTAALGVAASLLQERDVTPVLASLDAESLNDGDLLALWIKLAAWSAVANRNLDLLERAKGALAAWLGQSLSMDLEHSKLLVLLAECDAALHPGDARKWKALSQLGTQLGKSGGPLNGTAHLVRAAALARLGQREEAIGALDELLHGDSTADSTPTEPGLKSVAEGFRLGLSAADPGSDRAAIVHDLDQLIARARGETPPSPDTLLWLELWRRSLRLPAGACDLGTCSAKVLASAPELGRKLGRQVTRVLEQGLLPLGGVGLSLDYSFSEGLRPLVQLEPQLFALGP